jgi:hypothetical protein
MHNTDKVARGYLPVYEKIASTVGSSAAVCELGVYQGGSLELWKSLFPDGLIVGVDNNCNCTWPEGTRSIVCNQNSVQLPVNLISFSLEWDLIVDDASHDGRLSAASWRLLWPLLKRGGWYVIEDWIGTGDHMIDLARSFVSPDYFRWENGESVFMSVEYLPGLIVMRKAQ